MRRSCECRDEAWVKPALDAGAEGICFPLVRTADDAAECVSLLRYPPRGRRGWGPFVAHSRWGVNLFEYLPKRGDETVCMLLIETRAAVDNIETILGAGVPLGGAALTREQTRTILARLHLRPTSCMSIRGGVCGLRSSLQGLP